MGDVIALYAALFAVLFVRYGKELFFTSLQLHLIPFSLAFALWLLVFYIAGLYDLRRLYNNIDFVKTLSLALFVNALLTSFVFYFLPILGIAPKTNLFAFMAVFALIEFVWRRTFNLRATFREGLNRVLVFGEGKITEEAMRAVKQNPQVGYEITAWFHGGVADPNAKELGSFVRRHRITLVVIPYHMKHDEVFAKALFDLLTSGVVVTDTPSFYESVFRKIPLDDIKESWFLEHRIGERRFFDELKRGIEFFCALSFLILLAPLFVFLSLLIRLTSRGKTIYAQQRVGRHGNIFTLYKFRTMAHDSEKNGAQWSQRNDMRVTALGSFLRHTHLDELPQLWNIARGELSFVGPRPERPEFVTLLTEEIPYYEVRHLVKPGVTGWAQINYRYGASIEDSKEKLEYDLYYLKNRSLILDIAIVIKTAKTFFVNHT